jgi:hypothetical protein
LRKDEDAHANGPQNGRAHAKGAMPIASNAADESCKIEASALQKREEMAAEEQLAFLKRRRIERIVAA